MAKGATSKCNHSLTLSLLVLLNSLGTMQVDGEFSGSAWSGVGLQNMDLV